MRDHILGLPKGDRAFVDMLMITREVGLEPPQLAYEMVLNGNFVTANVVMTKVRRLVAPRRRPCCTCPICQSCKPGRSTIVPAATTCAG